MMTNLDEFKSSSARQAIAVASTPLFLAEQLLKDIRVQELIKEEPSHIYSALVKSLATPPVTLDDKVRPYALLVGLAIARAKKQLEKTRELNPENAPWFHIILAAVSNLYTPLQKFTVQTPFQNAAIIRSEPQRSNVNTQRFILGNR